MALVIYSVVFVLLRFLLFTQAGWDGTAYSAVGALAAAIPCQIAWNKWQTIKSKRRS